MPFGQVKNRIYLPDCKIHLPRLSDMTFFLIACFIRFMKHKISYLPDQSLKLRPGIHIQNTPDWSPYISFKNYSWGENLIKDQSISLFRIILLTLTTSTCDCVYLLLGENGCWSLLGFKGLTLPHNCDIAM